MKNIKYSLLLFFINLAGFSQNDSIKYNADDLMRFTFGVHKTYYDEANFKRANTQTGNTGSFDLSNSQGYFINFKVLKYKNHSLRAGLFLNSLQHELWYKGNITDIREGNKREVSTRPNPFVEKMLSIEYSLDYNYLLKVNKKWFIDISIGLSQERNQTYELYTYDSFNADINLIPYQQTASAIYTYKQKFYRTNYATSVGYKTNAGMFNFGLKYSIAKNEVANGSYEFFEPETNNEDQGYGVFSFSGNYVSFMLSFTPAKNFFKKKKIKMN